MTSALLISAALPRVTHPVDVVVTPQLSNRNRLTCAFRPLLAIPHIVLVGGPAAFAASAGLGGRHFGFRLGAGTGVLGAVALVIAIIAWFALLFDDEFPGGLWSLAVFYLSWRVRAVAYMALLRDDYPPFGEGAYPAGLTIQQPLGDRDRLSVAFRLVLVVPHIVAVWLLSVAWALTTLVAWMSILITGSYPQPLYQFGVGVLRWTTRVEAYLLLLHDEYPPFSLA